MNISSSLHDHQKDFRRKMALRQLVYFAFVLSVGLNVYLIFFDKDNPDAAPITELAEQPLTIPHETESQPELAAPQEEPQAGTGNSSGEMGVQRVSFSPQGRVGDREVRFLHANIQNSLNHTLCRKLTREEGCDRLSAYVGRLMAWFFDINSKMRSGDSLSLIYEMTGNEDRFRLLNLVYESDFFNKTFEANFYQGLNAEYGAYYDNDGQAIEKRILDRQAPVRSYTEITSLPGDYRKRRKGHSGTDFKTPVGTPVFATFEGKVTRTNWNTRANGYCIEIDHPKQGVKTLYLHLSRVLVKRGMTVQQGHQIAETGNTGRTFAPHLHFEIQRRDNKRIIRNPFKFKHIQTYYRQVSKEDREGFQKTVGFYNSVLQTS